MHADVAEDLLCGRCGYDLRGLDESQRCPECGAAILPAESRRLLVHASPLWLRTLTRGLWWLELSFGLLLALAVLLVLGISEGIVRAFEGLPLAAILLTLGAATIAASALSGCIGLLLATTPEPAERLHPRRGAWRRRTRGATVALMLGVAGAIASYSLPAWSRAVWTGAALMLSLLFVVLGVCFSRWMVELHARSQLSTVSGARMAVALTAVVASCGAAYGAAVLVALNRGYNAALSTLAPCLLLIVLAVGLTALGLLAFLVHALRKSVARGLRERGVRGVDQRRSAATIRH